METLKKAAESLAARLRACPVDDICERLVARTEETAALHGRLRDAWASARGRLEALVTKVVAETERVQQRKPEYVEALENLAPRCGPFPQARELAFDGAANAVKEVQAGARATDDGVDERLAQWLPTAPDPVRTSVDAKGRALVAALDRMTQGLSGPVKAAFGGREALAKEFDT